jgi:hypothetical protein
VKEKNMSLSKTAKFIFAGALIGFLGSCSKNARDDRGQALGNYNTVKEFDSAKNPNARAEFVAEYNKVFAKQVNFLCSSPKKGGEQGQSNIHPVLSVGMAFKSRRDMVREMRAGKVKESPYTVSMTKLESISQMNPSQMLKESKVLGFANNKVENKTLASGSLSIGFRCGLPLQNTWNEAGCQPEGSTVNSEALGKALVELSKIPDADAGCVSQLFNSNSIYSIGTYKLAEGETVRAAKFEMTAQQKIYCKGAKDEMVLRDVRNLRSVSIASPEVVNLYNVDCSGKLGATDLYLEESEVGAEGITKLEAYTLLAAPVTY